MDSSINKGSNANNPDLGWSQVKETVLMLELAAGQVEAAMKDSNNSVSVLTNAFTSMVGTLNGLSEASAKLGDEGVQLEVKASLQSGTEIIRAQVQQTIMAFQFYDRLVQRLDHVCHSLNNLSLLVSDKSRLFNPDEWVELQTGIRAKYTMEEEKTMFEAVLNGMPVKDALEFYLSSRMERMEESGGDVELF
jgi:hypothetical protein